MVLALLADIHSNLEALEACLAHARSRGATEFAFLGDLVGYGADPGPVIDIVAEHASRGAIAVKGNHDAAISGSNAYLNDAAQAAIAWSRGVLSARQRSFLEELPLCVRKGPSCFVHASAESPERWAYVDSPGAAQRSTLAAGTPYTFSGHVHDQALYGQGTGRRMIEFRPQPAVAIPVGAHRAWLAIVGSVGQPRDGNPAACYAIADLEAKSITFHRVAYDNFAAARKVRAAGLPEILAYRLERGA
jgi:diadenosine tetraphosphatase ApaH/serine/threonine PP2A family protein phosphatase